ncbi:MAG: TetR/AcrR family transcriptional regulator [Oscillospiraceae bacterium]
MAPKNKFTREEMIGAALRVVRAKGIDALTAKALAEELGTSTQPVFTCFTTMDALKKEVRSAAERVYGGYAAAGLQQEIPFLGVGTQYIRFAREEPELYRLLFLTPTVDGESGALEAMKRSQAIVRPSLEKTYRLSAEDADRYFRDLWLVVHSLATLIVTGGCPYSDAEIRQILTGFSVSICKAIKEIPGFTAGNFDRDALFCSLTER